jgi:hypothetical protein
MNESQTRKKVEITDIRHRALENLGYIRRAMEGAGSFTAVPGWGQVAAGSTALLAAAVAHVQPDRSSWLLVWSAELALAVLIVTSTMVMKAKRIGLLLTAAPARKTFLGMAPALAAGAVLTLVSVRTGDTTDLPGIWLLLYGAAIASGGVSSVRIVPVMGAAFMVCGLFALLSPPTFADLFLALGFGGLHIVFGARIAKHHGG